MNPRELSHELRRGDSPNLRRRRKVVALSLVAAGSMGLIALYQTGVIRRLPDVPLRGFDASKVDAAEQAYSYFDTPDALLGLKSYTWTAALAGAGGEDRVARLPWLPIVIAAKALVDAGVAAKLTWDQWAKHRAFCIWCLLAAACTFGIVPLVMPEARQAIRELMREPRSPKPVRSARSWARDVFAAMTP